MLSLTHLGKILFKILPLESFYVYKNELVLVSSSLYVNFICKFLAMHTYCQFKILTSISAVDYFTRLNRFEVNYDLLSIIFNLRIRLKSFSCEALNYFPSIVNIHPSANWWEREIWDLFGIFFIYNLDLRRLLTDYGFVGYPLRKDFPFNGYVDLSYNTLNKSFNYTVLESSQISKNFNTYSVWF